MNSVSVPEFSVFGDIVSRSWVSSDGGFVTNVSVQLCKLHENDGDGVQVAQ